MGQIPRKANQYAVQQGFDWDAIARGQQEGGEEQGQTPEEPQPVEEAKSPEIFSDRQFDNGGVSADSVFGAPSMSNAEDIFGSPPPSSSQDAGSPEAQQEEEEETKGETTEVERAETEEVEELGDEEGNKLFKEALLCGDLPSAVRIRLAQNRLDDALLLAQAVGAEFWEETRREVFRRKRSPLELMTRAAVNNDFEPLVTGCRVNGTSWNCVVHP